MSLPRPSERRRAPAELPPARTLRWPLLAGVRAGRALRDLHGVLRRLQADLGVVDLLQAPDELDPLRGLEHGVDLLGGLRVGAVERLPADVDVVPVVGQRERV